MTSHRLPVTAGALCIALAGCAVTRDYRPPTVDLPGRWSQALENGQSVPSETFSWWTTFRDPELDSLVDRARKANLDIQLAEARVREARARGGAAVSQWPSIDATASMARERESKNAPNPVLVRRNGEVESPGQPESLFQAGFDASWEVDLFGGRRRGIEASQADLEMAVYDRGAVLLTLIAEVARNYFELRGIEQQIRIARENLVAQQDEVALAQARYAAGMSTELDVARAEAQLQRKASHVPVLDSDYHKGVHRLSVLLGQPPDALAEELRSQRAVPATAVEPPLGLPSDLMRQRPDIRSAERRVAAASARLGAAITDLYPKFSLVGRAGVASVAVEDFFNGASAYWSVGPSLTWPLFSGGRIRATIEVRDAQMQQALIAYRRSILAGMEDVENAVGSFRNENARRGALVKAVAAAERTVKVARERYSSGLTDFRDVLAAQATLYEARSELAQSDTSLLLNTVTLHKALGGGWNVPAPPDREGEAK